MIQSKNTVRHTIFVLLFLYTTKVHFKWNNEYVIKMLPLDFNPNGLTKYLHKFLGIGSKLIWQIVVGNSVTHSDYIQETSSSVEQEFEAVIGTCRDIISFISFAFYWWNIQFQDQLIMII